MTVSRVQMLTVRFSKSHVGMETFLQNSYTGFHENSTNGWVAYTRSRVDGRTWSPHMTFFVLTHSRPTTHKMDSTGSIHAYRQVFVSTITNISFDGRRIMFWQWMIIWFVSRMLHSRGETWLRELDGIQQELYMCNWAPTGQNWNMSERICEYQTFRYSVYSHYSSAAEVHLSGLIGTASHPDMQKFRLIFFENNLHWQFEVTVCTCV
jgi:hypothetical protein